jgi:hypothetical protein
MQETTGVSYLCNYSRIYAMCDLCIYNANVSAISRSEFNGCGVVDASSENEFVVRKIWANFSSHHRRGRFGQGKIRTKFNCLASVRHRPRSLPVFLRFCQHHVVLETAACQSELDKQNLAVFFVIKIRITSWLISASEESWTSRNTYQVQLSGIYETPSLSKSETLFRSRTRKFASWNRVRSSVHVSPKTKVRCELWPMVQVASLFKYSRG